MLVINEKKNNQNSKFFLNKMIYLSDFQQSINIYTTVYN